MGATAYADHQMAWEQWRTKSRAVANGSVGPAMAGPIIEPVIYFYFFPDRTNNRASRFDFRNLC